MDLGLILKAGNVWKTLSDVRVGDLNPDGVISLFKQFGHNLPKDQAVAISALAEGADPNTVVTDFIMDGKLTNALMAVRGNPSSRNDALVRCPFCDNLHSA